MKVAIIGSGISGLSIANLLKEKHEVVIFEKDKKAGGLIKCERVQDCLFHKVGGHVFNSKNKKVLDWFWSFFDKENEFSQVKRIAKIFFQDKVIGYPIEDYLYNLDEITVRKIIAEVVELVQTESKSPFEYENFEAFLRANFGKTLYEVYFKPYNTKIWNTDLSTVPMYWLEGKLPMPNYLDILQNNILRKEEDKMVHASFYYPKIGGSQFIVDRLKEGIEIFTDNNVQNIEKQNGGYLIDGSYYESIVFCGDIRNMPALFEEILRNSGECDVEYLKTLRSNGTSNLFCETDDTDVSWLYIPENFTKAHRIIYTGNFSETNNRGAARKTCVAEFSGKVSLEVMTEEVKKLPGNLTVIDYNYEPNSYVIQDERTRAEIANVKKVLSEFNIYLLGRFAEWEYYNMDKAMEAAFTLSEKF